MPSASFTIPSLVSFFGVSALLFGFFLTLGGLGIIKFQNTITVTEGKPTWMIGVGLIALGTLFLFIDSSTSQSTNANAIPTTVALSIYDNFDNVAYDGILNSNLWNPKLTSTCSAVQKNGHLEFSNSQKETSVECQISAGSAVPVQELGALEAEIKIDSNINGGANQGINFVKNNAPGFFAFCGFGASPDSISLIFDVTSDGKNLIYQSAPAEFDRYYNFQLHFDYTNMQISCVVSGREIGRISVNDIPDIKDSLFRREVSGWRDENTIAIAIIDNVKIGKP